MEIYKTVVLALSFVNFHEVKSIVFVFYSVQGSVNPKPFNSHSELWYKYLKGWFLQEFFDVICRKYSILKVSVNFISPVISLTTRLRPW